MASSAAAVMEKGYGYSKTEVLLMDLRQPREFTDDLFAVTQPVAFDRLMSVLDEINGKYGRGTMRTASCCCTSEGQKWGKPGAILCPSMPFSRLISKHKKAPKPF